MRRRLTLLLIRKNKYKVDKGRSIMKILVAIDDSASSRAVVARVGGWSWPVGSTITVLSAYEMSLGPMGDPWLVPRDEERILKAAREQAQALVDTAVLKL
jgi:hypothetical protein